MSRITPLTVTLPDDLDAFIRHRVAAGRFALAGELIRAKSTVASYVVTAAADDL